MREDVIFQSAERLIARLRTGGLRVVCAESCTGGAVAAGLSAVPGASEVFCGSAVTYRERTKAEWLGVDPAAIDEQTAVSAEVATQMAVGVLQRTPEAHFAVSLTGHFGPQAPASQDGVVFIALAARQEGAVRLWQVQRLRLAASDRAGRRAEAVAYGLEALERIAVAHAP